MHTRQKEKRKEQRRGEESRRSRSFLTSFTKSQWTGTTSICFINCCRMLKIWLIYQSNFWVKLNSWDVYQYEFLVVTVNFLFHLFNNREEERNEKRKLMVVRLPHRYPVNNLLESTHVCHVLSVSSIQVWLDLISYTNKLQNAYKIVAFQWDLKCQIWAGTWTKQITKP